MEQTKEELEKRLKEIKKERELMELKKKVDMEEQRLKDNKSVVKKLIKRFL